MRESLQEAQAKVKEAMAEIDQEQMLLQRALNSLSQLSSAEGEQPTKSTRKRSRRKRARKGKRA
jgi:hypothetical protein